MGGELSTPYSVQYTEARCRDGRDRRGGRDMDGGMERGRRLGQRLETKDDGGGHSWEQERCREAKGL